MKSSNNKGIVWMKYVSFHCYYYLLLFIIFFQSLGYRNLQIENVKASVKNKLSIYGEYMPALINQIRKAHSEGKFSQLPRGPIGNYVEVPRRQYCDVIESILNGALLNSFIVNNKKDRS